VSILRWPTRSYPHWRDNARAACWPTSLIQPGQQLTLLDLDGVFVLSLKPSQVDALADRLADELAGRGETLESMLQTLREVRAEHA